MHSKNKKGFTLLEILVVLIIIGILAGIGFPNYRKMRENTLDKDAQANLRLIIAAERVYRMEQGSYVALGSSANINTTLKLLLTTGNPSWNYSTTASGSNCSAVAARNVSSGPVSRSWTMSLTSGVESGPTCSGSGCP